MGLSRSKSFGLDFVDSLMLHRSYCDYLSNEDRNIIIFDIITYEFTDQVPLSLLLLLSFWIEFNSTFASQFPKWIRCFLCKFA